MLGLVRDDKPPGWHNILSIKKYKNFKIIRNRGVINIYLYTNTYITLVCLK